MADDPSQMFVNPPEVPGQAQQSPEEKAALHGRWTDWLGDPTNRAIVTQMGLQLMQPIGVGQTVGGAAGQAIGGGLAAGGRQQLAQQEEATSREELALKKRQVGATEEGVKLRAQALGMKGPPQDKAALLADKDFNAWYKINSLNYDDTPEELDRMTEDYQKYKKAKDAAMGGGAAPSATPSEYPDAKQAPDGKWYIERGGKYYMVPTS